MESDGDGWARWGPCPERHPGHRRSGHWPSSGIVGADETGRLRRPRVTEMPPRHAPNGPELDRVKLPLHRYAELDAGPCRHHHHRRKSPRYSRESRRGAPSRSSASLRVCTPQRPATCALPLRTLGEAAPVILIPSSDFACRAAQYHQDAARMIKPHGSRDLSARALRNSYLISETTASQSEHSRTNTAYSSYCTKVATARSRTRMTPR